MAQQQVRRGGASSAFLWGGVFGAVVVALNLVNRFVVAGRVTRALRPALRPVAGLTLVSILLALAVISCYFLAGLLATRRAGRIEPGIFAGLIAGGIAGLGTLALTIIGAAMARHGLRMGIVGGIGGRRLFASVLASAVVGMLTTAVVGTGFGALGALVGRPQGGATAMGGGLPYQASPIAPGVSGYSSQPPSPGNHAGDDTPTIQTGSNPPTP